MFASLRRLTLLLTLLPQLLLLGLGRGVVVCVAPGGHMQVEVLASACCGGADSSTNTGAGLALTQDEPDCGSCSDLWIVVDSRVSRSSGARDVELPSDTALALAPEPLRFPGSADPLRALGSHLDRGQEPPHLIHLRSVVLRC